MSPERRTRKEQQAHTRACLLRSAARLLAQRGLRGASIDDIASDAGFTKGAFYANFSSKEELFLAMLDAKFAARAAEIEATLGADASPENQARRAGADFIQALRADPEWSRLFLEFAAHASRDEAFRKEFAARNAALRHRIADLFAARAAELGLTPAIPFDQLAQMTSVMAHGVAIAQMFEPEAVGDELFGTMLTMFFTGVATTAPVTPGSAP